MRAEAQSDESIAYLPYVLTPWQKRVKYDPHRFKVLCAGRRSGKTTLILDMLIQDAATTPKAVSWYVAQTWTAAKDIAWSLLKQYTKDFYDKGIVTRYYDGDLSIQFHDGLLQLKSGDKPDSLRGRGLTFLGIDEPAVMERELWEEALSPAITDHQAPVIFGGTPKGYNWFYDLYQIELKHPELWKSFHVTSLEAGLVPAEEIEIARRDKDPRAFRQEHEASFEVFGGQVFTDFSRDVHVTQKIIDFDPRLEYCLGMDFGWASPTAVLFINVTPDDHVIIFDELKAVETAIPEIALRIKERTNGKGRGAIQPMLIGCDPAGDARHEALGTSSVREMRTVFGFDAVQYKYNYPGIIQDRIGLIRKWLRNKKITICGPRCPNLVKAMEMYRYPDPKGDVHSEIPLKDGISDHWIDGLAYFFINRFPIRQAVVRAL